MVLQDLEERAGAVAGSRGTVGRRTMIHPLADQGEGKPASFVAREFSLDAVRGDETLRISALGLYRAFINGKRVGDDLLTPGLDLLRQAHRLPDLPGRRPAAAGREPDRDLARRRLVPLADHVAATRRSSTAGATRSARSPSSPRAARCCSRTDGAWQSGPLPILQVGHLFRRDLRRPARGPAGDRGRRGARRSTPACWCRRSAGRSASSRRSRSRESWTDREGRTIYDFGQNAAGYVAFTVRGEAGRAGDRRAFGDRRPRPASSTTATTARPRRGSSTC